MIEVSDECNCQFLLLTLKASRIVISQLESVNVNASILERYKSKINGSFLLGKR